MQRVLSVEASRNSGLTSEFVTKRLCCSFILTVAFFAVIGGFLLGRFVADRATQKIKMEFTDISKKILEVDNNLRNTFHGLRTNNCSAVASRVVCQHLQWIPKESSAKSAQETLAALDSCFKYG